MDYFIAKTQIGDFGIINYFQDEATKSLIVGQAEIDFMSILVWTTVIVTITTIGIPLLAVLFVFTMLSYYVLFFAVAWLPFALTFITLFLGGIAFLWVYLDENVF